MSHALSKTVKAKLRELVLVAHKKALQTGLEELCADADRWRRGEIDNLEFSDRVQAYRDGPNRKIYKRFTWSRHEDLPPIVASAIEAGLLDEKTIPDDVMATGVRKYLIILRSKET